MNTRKPLLTAGILMTLCAGIVSCQKASILSPGANSGASLKADLTVGPPPVITWWSSVAPIPYTSTSGDPLVSENNSIGFTINNKGFVLGGILFTKSGSTEPIKDLWMFDPATQAWSKRPPYPGNENGLVNAAVFVIGDNAYVVREGALWQYNQPANHWTRKSPFPGGGRILASAVAIDGKGYFGLGFDEQNQIDLNDWWQYDPGTDTWMFRTSLQNVTRQNAGAFAIGGKGYLCFGLGGGNPLVDLWRYDPVGNTWTQRQGFSSTGGPVKAADSVRIGGLDLGLVAVDGELREYNPTTNAWGSEGIQRGGSTSAGFVIGHTFFLAGISVATFNWSY